MKTFLHLFLAIGLLAAVRAQQLDNPTLIPVTYYGNAVVASTGFSSFSFGPSPTFTAGTSITASGGTGYACVAQTVYLIPGKEYNLTASSMNCGVVVVHFQPTNGQEIYLNATKANSYSGGANYTFKLRVEQINDLTHRLAGKRGGEPSALAEDKPIWYIGLGSLRNGRFAGAVGFRASAVTSDLYNTSSLIYDSVDVSEVSVTRDGSGYLTRIDARDVVLMMDAYNSAGTSYSIRAYHPTNLTTPFITYTISNYNSGAGVRIDKVEDGITWSTALQKVGSTWTRYDWQKSSVFPAGNITTTSVSGATSTVNYGSGTGMIVKTKTYSGGELASATLGSGLSPAQTTTYTYHTSTAAGGWPNAIASITEPSGKWTKYEYYNGATDTRAGLTAKVFRPWLDSPTTHGSASTANCFLESYDYATNYDNSVTALALKEVAVNGTTVAKSTWAYNWTYATVNSHTIAQIVRQDYSSSSSSLTTTTLAYRDDNPNSYFRGKLHAVTRPDGTKDAYAYYNGTWNPTTNVFGAWAPAGARQMLILHGQASSGTGTTSISSWSSGALSWTVDTVHMVPNLSTITEVIVNAHGQVVFVGKHVYTGGSSMEQIAAQANTYNGSNLLSVQKDLIRSVATTGGDVAVNYTYSAGLSVTRTDVDGTQTAWGYDDYLRNTTLTTANGGSGSYPAKVQTFTYYNSNLKNTSQECSCSPAVTTYSYDNAGRLTSTSEPKPGGGTLTTSYTYPSARQSQVTLPTGATKIADIYYDGRIKSQTGTAQVDTRVDYTYDSNYVYKTTKHGATTANGWTEEKTDWLGRMITQRVPQVTWTSGAPNKVVRRTFNYLSSTGQLMSVDTTDENAGSARLLPQHFYVYGNLGLVVMEGDDVNAGGSLDDTTTSTDRIILYTRAYYKDTSGYNGWIYQDVAQVRRTPNNATDVATVSDRRTRLTRFNNGALYASNTRVLSDVVEIDPSGRSLATWEWSNPVTRTRTRYVGLQGTSQSALTVWQDGYLKSEQSISGVTTTYTYNSLGLPASVTESTTNAATTYNYYTSTSYLSSTVQTTGAATTATTNYEYSWNTTDQSRTVKVTDAASNASYTEYNAFGQPWRTWGAAAKPTLFVYDSYGRRTGLRTWQSGSFTGTTWPSPAGGDLVTWNLDAATGAVTSKTYPNGSSVGFTYNPRGQLKTRTSARTPTITTTYNYFDTSGSMTGELQKIDYSDSTPDVTFTYNRFGGAATVNDAAGTRTFNYRSDLQVNTEVFDTFYGSRTLTATYDSNPNTPGRPTGYSFNGSATVSATVAYSAATERPSTIAGALGGTSTTFTLGYASGTDWVDSVTNGSYSRTLPLVSRYDVIDTATTAWTGIGTLGNFKALYTDARGWRNGHNSGSSSGTNATSWSKLLNLGDGLVSTYSYNGYGELTSAPTPSWQSAAGTQSTSARNFGWTYDLAGNRTSETGAAPTSYTSDALNRYTAITGTLAESPLSHDADGNLTQDGTWTYSYDAENRLIGMSKSGQSLSFVYDYAGRRIRKTVTGTSASDTKFLWSGWKLAAELAADGSTVQRTFIWGPDFSDAQGAAGGAGSLLAQISGATITFAMPDAFGNIVGYINGSGAIVAAAEYSPYGRAINTYGSITSYPIGYSGQYTDWETGLVYYGLRYYNPKHGRFINRDPIEEAGGANLYGFVGNNPTNGWDVLGLKTMRVCASSTNSRKYSDGGESGQTICYDVEIGETPLTEGGSGYLIVGGASGGGSSTLSDAPHAPGPNRVDGGVKIPEVTFVAGGKGLFYNDSHLDGGKDGAEAQEFRRTFELLMLRSRLFRSAVMQVLANRGRLQVIPVPGTRGGEAVSGDPSKKGMTPYVLIGIGSPNERVIVLKDGRKLYVAETIAHEIGHLLQPVPGRLPNAELDALEKAWDEAGKAAFYGYPETRQELQKFAPNASEAFAVAFANQVANEIQHSTGVDIGHRNRYFESKDAIATPGPMLPPLP